MEKKTRFKLNFIKSHLSRSHLLHKKPSRRIKQLFLQKDTTYKPLVLYKYYDPISIHRTIGDLVFLDKLSMVDDFVPLSSLWNPFKYIEEITITKDFTICNKFDSECFNPDIGFLVDRLLSLGETTCYNLAMNIRKFNQFFTNLPLKEEVKTVIPVKIVDDSKLLEAFLEKNSQNPIIMYHYKQHPKLGMVSTKVSVNTVLKNLTFQDDIRIFEESMFVCPTNQYFSYMVNHLESCFQNNLGQYITLYVNTYQGVKKLLAKGENFSLKNERIVALTFPKEAQTVDVQSLYEFKNENDKKIRKKKGNYLKLTAIEKCQKNDKTEGKKGKSLIKSFRDWENLIKKYYDPKEEADEKRRCHYRIINEITNQDSSFKYY